MASLACACGSDAEGSAAGGGAGGSSAAGSSAEGSSGAPAGNAGATTEQTPGGAIAGAGGMTSAEGPPDVNAGLDGELGSGANTSAPPGEAMPDPPVVPDPRPFFSFFVTSQIGLYGLPAGERAPLPDPLFGHGGNFGGLAGADEICTMLARRASPGDQKLWRAFLSTSGFDGGERVDAIDRIGDGPWYDYNGLKLADDVTGLLPEGNDGRPRGADAQLADMFTDENGEAIQPNTRVDNHDTLTGSDANGRLFDDGEDGRIATCEDWTSNTVRGAEGDPFGQGGQVPVGHSWPRSNNNGRHWMSDHTINGCEPGFDTDGGAGAPAGDFRVGAGGGYGAIYCFALGAVAPE